MILFKYIILILFIFQHANSSDNQELFLTYTEDRFGSIIPKEILTQPNFEFEMASEMISASNFKKEKIIKEDDIFYPPAFQESVLQEFNLDRLPIVEVEDPPIGLSIDGGGIRGLMPALLLEVLADNLHDQYQAQVQQVFDVFGGTSVGGLIALGLADGKPAADLVSIFREQREIIFPKKKIPFIPNKINNLINTSKNLIFVRYSNENLKNFLQQKMFPEGKRLSDLSTEAFVTTCGTDGFPHLLKSKGFGDQDLDYIKSHQLPVWQAALATSAAPTFFPAVRVELEGMGEKDLVDGGIWCNNPSFLVATHLMRKFQAPPHQVHILSLGTGRILNDNWLSRGAGPIAMAGPLIDALMRSHNTGNHLVMSTLFGKNYTRINPLLENAIQLDSTSDEAIDNLTQAANNERKSINEFLNSYEMLIRTKLGK